eukprot:174360_1
MVSLLIFLTLLIHIRHIFGIEYVPQYYLITKQLNWTDAQTYCQHECGSNLVSIHSNEEYNTLRLILSQHIQFKIWIGLFNDTREGQYKWADRTIFDYGNQQNTTPWANVQNSSAQNCVLLNATNQQWNTANCSTQHYFVCNNCYPTYHYISQLKFTWGIANAFCQSQCSSNLASVDGHFNNLYLGLHSQKHEINNNLWIGLLRQNNTYSHWIGDATNTYGIINGDPWTSGAPDNLFPQCTAVVSDGSLQWDDIPCNQFNNFACNNCDGRINKYLPIVGTFTKDAAETTCSNTFRTSLGSIHSDKDMNEAKHVCNIANSAKNCWIGLSDSDNENEFLWSDGTDFDWGYNISGGIYPWIAGTPRLEANSGDMFNCVHLNPVFDFQWVDNGCAVNLNVALCGKPSLFCTNDWIIVEGNNWDFQDCNLIEYTETDDSMSMAVLNNTQFMNSNSNL